MLVKFDDKLYYLTNSYVLTNPTQTGKKRTRQQAAASCKRESTTEIYSLLDCKNIREEIHVDAKHCTKVKTNESYDFKEYLDKFIENERSSRKHISLKFSYVKNPQKEYYLSSIDSILEDSLVVELDDGSIKRFKFEHLYIGCGDGFQYD